jgi:hypothetical protein
MGIEEQIKALKAAIPPQAKQNNFPPPDVEYLRDSVDAIWAALATIAKEIDTRRDG